MPLFSVDDYDYVDRRNAMIGLTCSPLGAATFAFDSKAALAPITTRSARRTAARSRVGTPDFASTEASMPARYRIAHR